MAQPNTDVRLSLEKKREQEQNVLDIEAESETEREPSDEVMKLLPERRSKVSERSSGSPE